MKFKYISKSVWLLAFVICFAIPSLKAQSKGGQNISDSSADKIAKKLSVSQEKAKQIQAAYGYKHEELTRLMKDNTQKPGSKEKQLKRLIAERKHKIDSTMTTAQKQSMRGDDAELQKRQAEKRNQLMQRHDAEMNRIAHRRTAKAAMADTAKKKVKTN